MNLEQWRTPLSADCPCGPDLEYDPDFLRLEQALRARLAPQLRSPHGDRTEAEGVPIAWAEVRDLAQALLRRSKDLRLAVWLTRAELHLEGFAAIGQGLGLVLLLLQEYWDGVHPRLDPQDGDPTMRLNALAALGALDAVAGDVRASCLLDSRQHGRLTVRELELALGRLEPPALEARPPVSEVMARLELALRLSPGLAALALEAPRQLEAIQALLADRLGDAHGETKVERRADVPLPDLSRLQAMLDGVAQALAQAVVQLTAASQASAPAIPGVAPGAASAAAGMPASSAALSREDPAVQFPGVINSRQQVIEMLALLCQYLEKNEPTNPVQILLRRAQRMMQMGFLELLRDMAPDGLDQAEQVVGEKIARAGD